MKSIILVLCLMVSASAFAYSGSVQYCVNVFEDGTKTCSPTAKAMGLDCAASFRQSTGTWINGKKVVDVYNVTKQECSRYRK